MMKQRMRPCFPCSPPRHLTIERDQSDSWQTTRILYHSVDRSVVFLIPFTLLWTGGILFALMDFYGKMSASHNDLFPLIFILPFFLGSFLLCGFSLFQLFGKTVLTLRKGEGKYFCGIGQWGKTRLTWEWGGSRRNRRSLLQIVIRTPGKPLFTFYAAISDSETRAYLMEKLREKCREIF